MPIETLAPIDERAGAIDSCSRQVVIMILQGTDVIRPRALLSDVVDPRVAELR